MKLDKETRHKIYTLVLENVESKGWRTLGFCYLLGNACDVYGLSIDVYKNLHRFKEIYKRRPKGFKKGSYFFRLCYRKDVKRERILKLAIKETKPTKKNVKSGLGKRKPSRNSLHKSSKGN